MRRPIRTVLIGALVAPLIVVVSASPASAIIQTVHCSGTYEENYDPGITNTPQDVDYTTSTDYADCDSTDAALTSGTSGTGGTSPDATCVALLQPGSGQTTVTWNTSETTVYNWTAAVVQVGDTMVTTITGTVVAGKFLGGTVVRQSTYLQETVESQCSSEGLTQITGPATLTITKLL